MNLPDFLHQGLMGEIRFVGSRIDLYFVIERYNEGASPEAIALEYETVSLPKIHKAIAFYLENKPEVDLYLRAVNAEITQLEATTPRVNIAMLRERLANRQAALVPQSPTTE
jgi:uncharacterized protein (DUF433 family)